MMGWQRKRIPYLPIAGLILSMGLLVFASCHYAASVPWSRVTVSLLCAAELPSGEPNAVRSLAIAALLLLCLAMAMLFELISRQAEKRGLRKTIQIAGIGSMVYALLTASPMHDLMVNIALVFFVIALIAIVYMLVSMHRYTLAALGLGCIALKVISATLYYSDTYEEVWGGMQKLSFLATVCWLVGVHLGLGWNAGKGAQSISSG